MILKFKPTAFDSWSDYWQFVFAREFVNRGANEPFSYHPTLVEQIGGLMVKPTLGLVDQGLKNIRNPAMIVTLTGIAVIAVTILFYPDQFTKQITQLAPVVLKIEPWMLKATLFTLFQTIFLGLGLRTLGRLHLKGELWQAWKAKQIRPITVGTILIRT